jgi:hypothetical protein
MRRAAATEQQGDNTAKQVTMSWLQGNFTEDEFEALDHWITLLKAVLDLQQKQQQQAAVGGEQQQQQPGGGSEQQQGAAAVEQPAGAVLEPAAQPAQQQQDHAQAQPPMQQSSSSIPAAGADNKNSLTDKELLAWLRAPGNKDLLAWLRAPGHERHHLRVMLECLKEIRAVDLPARVLLGHKVTIGTLYGCCVLLAFGLPGLLRVSF